jgi:hypothetical protein
VEMGLLCSNDNGVVDGCSMHMSDNILTEAVLLLNNKDS